MNGDGVTADELVQVLARRRATLPAEIGTFIVLEGAEAMLAGGARELASLANLRISAQGQIALSGPACDDEQGVRSLHRAFTQLLTAAGPRLPPALARLSAEGPRGEFTLRALRDELEAALVPLNRHASRRVLARFVREAALPPLLPDEVDAALDSLLDAAQPPANDAPGKASHVRTRGPAVPLQDDAFTGLERDRETPVTSYEQGASGSKRPPSRRPSERGLGRGHGPRTDQLVEMGELPAPSTRKLFLGMALIAMAIAGVALALVVRSRRASVPVSQHAETQAPAPPAAGDLVVHVSEPEAQVLRFVGPAPAVVERLPVGAAHEFVATAEGYRPARVLVPADADWEATAEGARYEVALQLAPLEGLAPANAEKAQLELGPSRLAAQATAPGTRLGTIRVVATPRGARVYQLVGFSPDVSIQDLPLGAHEFLIYRQGYAPALRMIAPSDFKPEGTRLKAALRVELEKR